MRRQTESNYKGSSRRTGIFLHPCRRRRRMIEHSYRYVRETCNNRRWSGGFFACKKKSIYLMFNNVIQEYFCLPAWPWGGPYYGSEADTEEVLRLAQIDDIEDDSLVLVNILNGEIKPQPTNIMRTAAIFVLTVRATWAREKKPTCISGYKYPVWRTNHIQTRWWSPLCQGSRTRISRQNKDDLS